MATDVFIQRSRLGKRVYELKDSTLTISGTFQFRKFERRFPLGFTSPNYIRVRRRLHWLIQFPLFVAVVALVAIKALSFLPEGLFEMVVEFFGMILVVSVLSAIRGIAPVEVVIFKNTSGRAQFDLVKETKQAAEFEEFVATLSNTIRGESTSDGLKPEIQNGDPVLESTEPNYYWIASVVLGGMSILIPQVSSVLFPGVEWTFLPVFLCSFGGIGLCIYSFLKAERFRYISVVGAVLSIAPVILFKWT
jgi:hypothetical protein